jgi:aquaporin Z
MLGSLASLKRALSGKGRSGLMATVFDRWPAIAFKRNWRLYVYESVELATFMIAACCASVWLFDPAYPILHLLPSSALRRLFMGIAMGTTAVLIIQSPFGKRSGAHFNPAITFTYFRLGKIGTWDTIFYMTFQFLGGVYGVGLSAICLGKSLAGPSVDYAVTVPGRHGTTAAFMAECFMAALLMAVVLWFSSRPAFSKYTSYLVGILITFYVLIFAPVSGFSINPARTVGSAVFAGLWTAAWLYFVAPVLGMMVAAEVHLRVYGIESILCAKLYPDPDYPCSFRCHYPGHRHRYQTDFPLASEQNVIS